MIAMHDLQRHTKTGKHVTAEGMQAAVQKCAIDDGMAAASAKVQAVVGPLESKLMRCAFTVFKNNQVCRVRRGAWVRGLVGWLEGRLLGLVWH